MSEMPQVNEELLLRIAALEEQVADQSAVIHSLLLISTATLRGLKEGRENIGAFNTARMILRRDEKRLVQENARGPSIRVLQIVLRELFGNEPFGPEATPESE